MIFQGSRLKGPLYLSQNQPHPCNSFHPSHLLHSCNRDRGTATHWQGPRQILSRTGGSQFSSPRSPSPPPRWSWSESEPEPLRWSRWTEPRSAPLRGSAPPLGVMKNHGQALVFCHLNFCFNSYHASSLCSLDAQITFTCILTLIILSHFYLLSYLSQHMITMA